MALDTASSLPPESAYRAAVRDARLIAEYVTETPSMPTRDGGTSLTDVLQPH